MKKVNIVFVVFLINLLSACGSSSSGTTSTIQAKSVRIRGELESKEIDAAGRRLRYVGYQVCSFGVCSTTDEAGIFLFSATLPSGAVGIEFSITGPEFNGIVGFPLSTNANEIEAIILRETGTNKLEIGQVLLDGVEDTTVTPGGFNDGD